MWTAKDARRARPYTTRLSEMVEEGEVDKDSLINDLLGYLSEDDVKQFCRSNDYIAYDPDDEDEDDDVDPDYPDGVDDSDYEVTGCGDEYDIEYDR